jgi:hydrogenase expression/formation protein HypC
MCIGLPMQVQSIEPGHAWAVGGGELRRVRTALVGSVKPGDWLLVFLDDARERMAPERAAEVQAALDLLQQALAGAAGAVTDAREFPGFDLPSRLGAAELRALTASPAPRTPPAQPLEQPE